MGMGRSDDVGGYVSPRYVSPPASWSWSCAKGLFDSIASVARQDVSLGYRATTEESSTCARAD
jgi:hypothetical protein